MPTRSETKALLEGLLEQINGGQLNRLHGGPKGAKLEQIIGYLEPLAAELRQFSRKRELVIVECGAGNCFLSLAVYFYCSAVLNRAVTIHCLDTNERLMDKARALAGELDFDGMHFHACDIGDYVHPGRVDVVMSLHACDTATDKSLYLGVRSQARCILSVSCCQHTIRKPMRASTPRGLTKHRVLKERLVYMVGDSLRALLLESQGYGVDMVEFVSSRHTDKNVMLRARREQRRQSAELIGEYERLQAMFNITPALERYLDGKDAAFGARWQRSASVPDNDWPRAA